jgi:hypothetical protein
MIFQTRLKAIVTYFFRQYKHKKTFRKDVTDQWLLFTLFTAAYAQKSQNSDFAHVCLGCITQKQRENTLRRQRVSGNRSMTASFAVICQKLFLGPRPKPHTDAFLYKNRLHNFWKYAKSRDILVKYNSF